MIELLYQLLNQVGFTHPLHPAVTHLPMGMTMGAFIFGVAALKWEALVKTARHCVVVGLIFIPPTMITGVLDWQHFYDGEWFPQIIIKLVLAVVLFFLLLGSLKASSGEGQPSRLSIVVYALCLLTAIGLGFTAGEIQYG